MKHMLQTIDTTLNPLRKIADCIGAPLWDLLARLYLAYAFFSSGLLRLNDYLSGNWMNQISLFMSEHPVPGIPAEISSVMATTGELVLPVLVAFGLFTRFGAAGMLMMTAVIEFTYGHFTEHIIWAFLALSLFVKGPGVISLDALILKWIRNANPVYTGRHEKHA